MAKKTVKKNVVTPDPKDVKTGIGFDDLVEGEYFIREGRLNQKTEDTGDQTAVDCLNGDILGDLCDEKVIPVAVTITWETK